MLTTHLLTGIKKIYFSGLSLNSIKSNEQKVLAKINSEISKINLDTKYLLLCSHMELKLFSISFHRSITNSFKDER